MITRRTQNTKRRQHSERGRAASAWRRMCRGLTGVAVTVGLVVGPLPGGPAQAATDANPDVFPPAGKMQLSGADPLVESIWMDTSRRLLIAVGLFPNRLWLVGLGDTAETMEEVGEFLTPDLPLASNNHPLAAGRLYVPELGTLLYGTHMHLPRAGGVLGGQGACSQVHGTECLTTRGRRSAHEW